MPAGQIQQERFPAINVRQGCTPPGCADSAGPDATPRSFTARNTHAAGGDGSVAESAAPRNSAACGNEAVPPVGLEPTLALLLGGRPLPLGYGGWPIIHRRIYINEKQIYSDRQVCPGTFIQLVNNVHRMRSVTTIDLRHKRCVTGLAHKPASQRPHTNGRRIAHVMPALATRPNPLSTDIDDRES